MPHPSPLAPLYRYPTLKLWFLVSAVFLGGYGTAWAWDKLTGAKPEEFGGRRAWTDDPVMRRLQGWQEFWVVGCVVGLVALWVTNLIALWQAHETTLFWVVASMIPVGSLLVWGLTRKPRRHSRHTSRST